MRNSAFTSFYFLGAIAVISLLSACSGGGSSEGGSSSGSPSVAPTVQTLLGAIQGLERSYTPPVASGASVSGSGTQNSVF